MRMSHYSHKDCHTMNPFQNYPNCGQEETNTINNIGHEYLINDCAEEITVNQYLINNGCPQETNTIDADDYLNYDGHPEETINIHDYLIIDGPPQETNTIDADDYLNYDGHPEETNNIHDYLIIDGPPQETISVHDYLINDGPPEETINIHDYLIIDGPPEETINIHDYLIIDGPPEETISVHDYLINGTINIGDYLNYDGPPEETINMNINNNNVNQSSPPPEEMNNNNQQYMIDRGSTPEEENMIDSGYDEFFKKLPIGYHFLPDDSQLIYYLRKKVNNEALPPNKIRTLNLYQFHPQNLADILGRNEEKEWYLFTQLKARNKGAIYADRTTPNGHWKATSGDRPIVHRGEEIGSRKTLVYYEGKSSKTDWIMHEYKLNDHSRVEDTLVLCRIHNHKKGN